jgi:hypothetical protein
VSGLCKRLFRSRGERGCFNIFEAFKIIFVGGIFFGEKVGGAYYLLMVGIAVMFGEVIGLIETAFAPINYKLALASTVADPIEAHVDGFGSLLLDSVVGDTGCSGIVSGNRSWGLLMAEFFECDSEGAGFATIVEKGGKFGLSGAGKYFAHNVAHGVDGAVVRRSGIGGMGCLFGSRGRLLR